MHVSQEIPGLGKQKYLQRHRFSYALSDFAEFVLVLGLFSLRSSDGSISVLGITCREQCQEKEKEISLSFVSLTNLENLFRITLTSHWPELCHMTIP